MKRFGKKTIVLGLLVFTMTAALVLAKGGAVIIDGTSYAARVITQNGVQYIAAPDIAKALGKSFQVHNGTLVLGAPGGKNPGEATLVESGKWGFNKAIRFRVLGFNPSDGECGPTKPASVSIEMSNATNGAMTFNGLSGWLTGNTHSLSIQASANGTFIGDKWQYIPPGIPPSLPPAAHVTRKICAQFSGTPDLLTVSTGLNDGYGNFKPLGTTVKFKLAK